MASDILERVKKLLELAKSDNEHEAAAAAARATALMLEHQIEEADLEAAKPAADQKVEPAAREVIEREKRHTAWKSFLRSGLANAFGGLSYYSGGYQVTSYIVAPAPAMQAIRYMYGFLTREVDRLADIGYAAEYHECLTSNVEPPPARAWKSAFRVGAASTIQSRLSSQRQTTHSAARKSGHGAALMIIDKQAEACVTLAKKEVPGLFTKGGKLRSGGSTSAGQSSSSGYAAGKAAGASVNLGGNRGLGAGTSKGSLR